MPWTRTIFSIREKWGSDRPGKTKLLLKCDLGQRALVKRAELVRALKAGKTALLPAVGDQRYYYL